MIFSDLNLARRLEAAEGFACAEFARTRARLLPASGAISVRLAGADVVFDGVDSPVTQTFGLGIFEPLTPAALSEIENFFFSRGAAANHEVSPFAGVATADLLCRRGYKPIELSSVLYRPVEEPEAPAHSDIRVRRVAPDEVPLWADVSSRGWTHEHPEFREFLTEFGKICAAREGTLCFLGEIDGKPGAAAVLSIHKGVAMFAGSATVPEMRRRGLQSTLLHERMRYAFQHGCDLALMAAEVGSESQRNAQRKGFQIAYTRTKWQKAPSSAIVAP